jgi:hypothetical protein
MLRSGKTYPVDKTILIVPAATAMLKRHVHDVFPTVSKRTTSIGIGAEFILLPKHGTHKQSSSPSSISASNRDSYDVAPSKLADARSVTMTE